MRARRYAATLTVVAALVVGGCGSTSDGPPERDAGSDPDAAVAPDAEMPAPDAGPAPDAAMPSLDASTDPDAGTARPDAGMSTADAGPPDDPTAGLSVTFRHPGIMVGLSPTGTESVFPTYIAHLFGTPESHPIEMRTTCVEIESTRADTVALDLEVRFPGYATPSVQSVSVDPGTSSVCLDPTFDLSALYSLTAVASGRIESELRYGTRVIANDMLAMRTLPVNDVLWWHETASRPDMNELTAVFVEPNDPSVETVLPAVAARVRFRGPAGAWGYVRNGYERPVESISVGYHVSEWFFAEPGESTSWDLPLVDGLGSGDDIDVLVFTAEEYDAWLSGSTATAWQWPDQVTGDGATFTAPSLGWYVFALSNSADNWVSRDVRWYRTPIREEVVRDSLVAIFDELRSRGVTYTNISDAYFAGSQHVRRVGETLSTNTGNCIDGTLVFASLLELMGLEAVLTYVSGHAFIGVRSAPDPGALVWYLETTMVGGAGGTGWDAYLQGLDNYLDAVDSGDPALDQVPVADARAMGIVPFSR